MSLINIIKFYENKKILFFKKIIYIQYMSCKECKKKDSGVIDEIQTQVSLISKGVVVFMLVWSMLAIYGLYSLITKFI